MGKHCTNHNVCFCPAIGWEDPPGCSIWEGSKGVLGKEIAAIKRKSDKKYLPNPIAHVTTKSLVKKCIFFPSFSPVQQSPLIIYWKLQQTLQ